MGRVFPYYLSVLVAGACAAASSTASTPPGNDPGESHGTEGSEANAPDGSIAEPGPTGVGGQDPDLAEQPSTEQPSTTALQTDASAANDGAPPPLPKPQRTKVDNSCGRDPGLGQSLKPFSLKTLDGKTATQAQIRGRVTLVNFWGTWCKPCLEELPEFAALYRRYRKHGLGFVAIATDEDPVPVREYVQGHKIPGSILIGAEDYAGEYSSPKFPFTFLVDESGVVRAAYRGYRPECLGKLEADIREHLAAPKKG